MISDTNKSIFPRSVLYLYSLGRLYYITAGVVIFIVISAFILYCPLKFGDETDSFTSHIFQYQYRISGVFLHGSAPAFGLTIFHSLVLCLLLGAFYLIFIKDWNGVLRLAPDLATELCVEPYNGTLRGTCE